MYDSMFSYSLGEYELFLLPAEVQMKSAILRFHHIYSPIRSPSHRPLTAEAWNNMKDRLALPNNNLSVCMYVCISPVHCVPLNMVYFM